MRETPSAIACNPCRDSEDERIVVLGNGYLKEHPILSYGLLTGLVAIPIYLMYQQVDLLDTRIGMGLIQCLVNLPLVLVLLATSIAELPEEIEEAARVDGANTIQLLTRIVAPISVNVIAASGGLAPFSPSSGARSLKSRRNGRNRSTPIGRAGEPTRNRSHSPVAGSRMVFATGAPFPQSNCTERSWVTSSPLSHAIGCDVCAVAGFRSTTNDAAPRTTARMSTMRTGRLVMPGML